MLKSTKCAKEGLAQVAWSLKMVRDAEFDSLRNYHQVQQEAVLSLAPSLRQQEWYRTEVVLLR